MIILTNFSFKNIYTLKKKLNFLLRKHNSLVRKKKMSTDVNKCKNKTYWPLYVDKI